MTSHSLSIVEVSCEAIYVGERHRRDLGDLEGLAESIATEGLLQPIGITEDNTLVFGERRLRAVQEVLRRDRIPARVVHVRSITSGEYAENELRKDFTPSERVAIGAALEAELGNRQGHRTDIQFQERIPEVSEPRRNCGEVVGRTLDIAAKKAGFGSTETYERAKKAVDHGAPVLVAAMDAGEISISAASVIATEPPERQEEIVRMPGELRRQIVREIREADKLPTPSEARRIARETGMSVADNTGVYRSGASPDVVRKAKADMHAIYAVTRGILAIADSGFDPVELAARLEYWHCPDIRAKSTPALEWLTRFVKGLEANDSIS